MYDPEGDFEWNDVVYPTFAAWQAATGEDVGSIRLSRNAVGELYRLAHIDLTESAPEPAGRSGELLKIVEVYLQNHFQKFSGLRSLELLRELETPSRGNGQ